MNIKFKKLILGLLLTISSSSIFAEGFTLKSKDLSGQTSKLQVFNGFGCKGDNISPHLSWENAPKGTKSFAITMYDPDAPTGSGWWHWLVFDIEKNTSSIPANASARNALPLNSIESKNDYSTTNFGGSCPPKGDKTHMYLTTIHALDVVSLGLDNKANPALVGYMINAHTLKKSSLVTYYKR